MSLEEQMQKALTARFGAMIMDAETRAVVANTQVDYWRERAESAEGQLNEAQDRIGALEIAMAERDADAQDRATHDF